MNFRKISNLKYFFFFYFILKQTIIYCCKIIYLLFKIIYCHLIVVKQFKKKNIVNFFVFGLLLKI